jgi:hypothetical protein
MSRCRAGECEVECGGSKGCGCIAESDNPFNCACFCFGESSSIKDLRLEPSTTVDVSINDLPLYEVAEFLSRVHTARVVAPAGRLSEQVSLNVQRKSLDDVMDQLGLTTMERIRRQRWRAGLLMFLAGLAVGALMNASVGNSSQRLHRPRQPLDIQ